MAGSQVLDIITLPRPSPTSLPIDRIVVGTDADRSPLEMVDPAGFDLLLTERPRPPAPWVHCGDGIDAALDALTASVDRSPQAALVLAQVLRTTEHATLGQALIVESLAYSTLQAGQEFRRWLHERPAPSPSRRPDGAGPPVGLTRDGATLRVQLQRPWVRNAIDAATRDGLVEAFELARLDSSIEQIELSGQGPSFSSGGDLAEFGTTPDPATAHLIRTTQSPARTMAASAAHTTATVHGACVGAGIELAALAGRIVAAPDSFFLLPELGLGLIPGAGGTATMPRRIGRHRTAWMGLSGLPVDPSTALHWGLIDEVTPQP